VRKKERGKEQQGLRQIKKKKDKGGTTFHRTVQKGGTRGNTEQDAWRFRALGESETRNPTGNKKKPKQKKSGGCT